MASQTNFNTVPAHGVAVMIHRDHEGFVIGPIQGSKQRGAADEDKDSGERRQQDGSICEVRDWRKVGGGHPEGTPRCWRLLLVREAATPRVGMNPTHNMFRPFPGCY